MKLRVISDIHFTDGINGNLRVRHSVFNSYFGKQLREEQEKDLGNDVITLIAGDMATGMDYTKAFLEGFFPHQKVIFIEGNHLCYQKGLKTLDELKNELKTEFPKDHLLYNYLENDWMFLDPTHTVAIIGSTFYTDYKYWDGTVEDYNKRQKAWGAWTMAYGLSVKPHEEVSELTEDMIVQENMFTASGTLNDFRWGWETPSSHLTPNYYKELNIKAQEEIKRCYDEIMAINPSCKVILMTHHCLLPKCIDEKYKNHKSNASYVSDLEDWVNGFENIKLVISGHVHCRKDFEFGNGKRYIVNACGYANYREPFEGNKFNVNKIIDTDDL